MSDERLGLHNLPKPKGATKEGKRKGRGVGSGLGKTAGRGQKGQRSRSGGGVRLGFEGGQMPLIRRVPKRGFNNIFRVENQIVKLGELSSVEGDAVTPDTLLAVGLIRKADQPIKLLVGGDPVARAFKVSGCKASKTAQEQIEKAGGSFEA
jgi:large subunit ribosomal protein L15